MSKYTNTSTTATTGGGVTITGLLQLAFIILKLCNVIDWSWFWVLFPAILGLGIIVLAWIILGIILLIKTIKDNREDKRRKKEYEQRIQQIKEERQQRLDQQKKERELQQQKLLLVEGLTYPISYEDLKDPAFPKLNEWLLKKKFEFQLKYRYSILGTATDRGDIILSGTAVSVIFYNAKFESQEKNITLHAGDLIRIFPCEEKINVFQVVTLGQITGRGTSKCLGGEDQVQELVFEKDKK